MNKIIISTKSKDKTSESRGKADTLPVKDYARNLKILLDPGLILNNCNNINARWIYQFEIPASSHNSRR